MDTTQTKGVRCHGDACCFGQKPCPSPAMCGVIVFPSLEIYGTPMPKSETTYFWAVIGILLAIDIGGAVWLALK